MSQRRVLVVSPHFPPANGADVHRVRVTIPFFEENGWQVDVLCVDPRDLAVPQDPWLQRGLPPTLAIHRCRAWSLRWSCVPGLGNLDLRAHGSVRRMGDRILKSGSFDLVYFSTTVFSLTTLGPRWKKRFGVPFVVDYQDPWFTDYYHQHPDVNPPGGRLKYSIVHRNAKKLEPKVIRECSGITAVSAAYVSQLRDRYPSAEELPVLVAPFPGSRRDFERVATEAVSQSVFDPHDGKSHWVYVGVSGPIMYRTLRAFFKSLAAICETTPVWRDRVQLHFIGTSYAPAGTAPPVVKPLAEDYGVGEMVHEQTDRIPYSQALRCLLDATALLVPGSDDATYNASKLLPYVIARKPLLAIFHRTSPVCMLLSRIGGATLVSIDNSDTKDELAAKIHEAWFRNDAFTSIVPIDNEAAEAYTDRGQARQLCRFFDTVTENKMVAGNK